METTENSDIYRVTGIISWIIVALVFLFLASCSRGSPDGVFSPGAKAEAEALGNNAMEFTTSDFTYYADGKLTELDLYPGQVAISAPDDKTDQLKSWLESEPLVKKPVEIEDIGKKDIILVSLAHGATADQILELIKRLNQSGLINYASPVFGNADDKTIITDEFVVRFKDTYSVTEIENFIAGKNVTIIKKDFLWSKCYILGFTSQSGPNTLNVASEFYKSGMVVFAHPNFITVTKPPWVNIVQEDFEGDFPEGLWGAYDANPEDGEYYWGKFSKADYNPIGLGIDANYASRVFENWSGDYVAWCAASHDSASPDVLPNGDNCPESWPKNMDAWLKYGPIDLSNTYWAKLSYRCDTHPYLTDDLELLVSVDNENWYGGMQWGIFKIAQWGGMFSLNYVPELGDVTGQDNVWIALRFKSDDVITDQSSCMPGVFVDDINIQVSNIEPSVNITPDPLSSRQWGLKNTGQSGGAEGYDINITDAWAFLENTGGIDINQDGDVIVAVIDEGVESDHEDLNVIEGYDATYDPSDPESMDTHGGPNPLDGHGTCCAGIIGAKNNSLGVVGVAPGVKIMPVRIAYHPEGGGNWVTEDSEIADGILWAVNNNAKVLSNSWGGGPDADIIHNAIRDAKDAGCIILFSSGNSGGISSPSVRYPARYEETIAVGAMAPDGERKSFESCDEENWESCYGPELDIVAPGVMIPTTDMSGDNGYARINILDSSGNYFMSFNGTSSACPHVAGIVALMLRVNPDLDQDQVRAILTSTARDLGEEDRDDETGHGLVDAYRAVHRAAEMHVDLSQQGEMILPDKAYPGDKIQADMTIINNGIVATGPFYVQLYLSKDGVVDPTDTMLWYGYSNGLGPSEKIHIHQTTTFPVPQDTPTGSYYIIVWIDGQEMVYESDEENNIITRPISIVYPPNITLKPESIDFGEIAIGSGADKDIQITNEGQGYLDTLQITSIVLSGDTVFDNPLNVIPETPFDLGGGESSTITLYFQPQLTGTFSGSITIYSNDPVEPEKLVRLTGTGVEAIPVIHVPGMILFDQGETSKVLNIENQGNAELTWSIGPDDYQHIPWPTWLSMSPLSGQTSPGATSDVDVTADRTGLAVDTYVYNVYVSSNDPNHSKIPVLITLKVTELPPVLNVSTNQLDFGTDKTQLNLTISNTGEGDLTWGISDLSSWLDTDPKQGTIAPGEGTDVQVSVDRGQSPGQYSYTLHITSGGGSADVLVTMEVLQPLEITPDTATLDHCGGEQEFSVIGGAPPYTFELTAPEGESVPDTLELLNIDQQAGTATLRIGACSISSTISIPDELTTVDARDINVTDITVTDNVIDTVVPSNMVEQASAAGMKTQCGGTSVILKVTDSIGNEAYASIGLSGDTWARAIGGIYVDDIWSIEPTPDGFIMAGRTYSFGAGNIGVCDDLWVVKLLGNGKVAWQKTYGTSAKDGASMITCTSDGGYILAGDSIHVYQAGTWIFKLDASGNVTWHRVFKDSYFSPAAARELGTGYMVAGTTGDNRIALMKLDNTGNLAWADGDGIRKLYNIANTSYSWVNDMVLTPDGDPILVGAVSVYNPDGSYYNQDLLIMKLDNAGSPIWCKTLGRDRVAEGGNIFDYYEDAISMAQDTDGNLVVLGNIDAVSFGDGGEAGIIGEGGGDGEPGIIGEGGGDAEEGYISKKYAWVIKFNSDGDVAWQRVMGGLESNNEGAYARSIHLTPDGGYVIAGRVYTDEGEDDYWVVKLDASGNILWQKIYGGAHTDQANAITATADGSIVVTGQGQPYIFGGSGNDTSHDFTNAWVLRLDTEGSMGCNP